MGLVKLYEQILLIGILEFYFSLAVLNDVFQLWFLFLAGVG